MVTDVRVVAVGFLSEQDLRRLGDGFDRYFPIQRDDMFADLLAELDKVEAVPAGDGVTLRPTPKS